MGFREAFAGTGDGLLIATAVEGTIALVLMLARIYTTWHITKRPRLDLYLSLLSFASAPSALPTEVPALIMTTVGRCAPEHDSSCPWGKCRTRSPQKRSIARGNHLRDQMELDQPDLCHSCYGDGQACRGCISSADPRPGASRSSVDAVGTDC